MVTGLGFFTEGYVLFSVGNILTLFDVVWASCYKQYVVCNETLVQAINYLKLTLVISNSSEVVINWIYNLINVACDSVGYHLAALLIDHKGYRRKRMQVVGFAMSLILFIIAAAIFPVLNQKGSGGHAFEFIYFFSSFWIQFGHNSTNCALQKSIPPCPCNSPRCLRRRWQA